MARIVGIHGIGQQLRGENVLRSEWLPPLCDGLLRAGAPLPSDEDLSCAFYGDLFRPKGKKSLGEPRYRASDVGTEWEAALLRLWWEGAAAQGSDVPGPDAATKVRTPQWAQRALNGLSKSRFFAGIAERLLIFDLKQVYLYLNDEAIRRGVCERVTAAVTPDTRVIVAHSLGTLPAYECLCAHPEWPVQSLVTFGSPLGIRNLIYERLRPAPPKKGLGRWPGSVRHWTNIADGGDVVALVKDLSSQFGKKVKNHLIYNGATAHWISPYLSSEEAGHAIAEGLA
jgi:hypothetical protein